MTRTLGAVVLAVALFHGSKALAKPGDAGSGTFFVTIDGIQGESTQKGHEGQIEGFNLSETWRQSATPGGAGGGAGKATLGPVVFDKVQGAASVKLLKALLTGQALPRVVIDFADAQGVPTYRITLENVIVVGLNEANAGGQLVDEVQLAFESAIWEVFNPPDATSFDGKTGKVNVRAPAGPRSTR
jgi:type VI secretion system secreted protein Hcp